MFHPFIYDESDRIQLTVNNGEPVDMALRSRTDSDNWMVDKYGQDKFVTPFEATYEFHARDFEDHRNPEIYYEYHLVHGSERTSERLSNQRFVKISSPKNYRGINTLPNSDQIFIVNGHATRQDGNFVSDFQVYQVGQLGIYFGSYPLSSRDFEVLQLKDIKAVLCLQTQQEMKNLNLLWNVMTQDFKAKDIYQTKNIEIDEFTDRAEYVKGLLRAAQYIDNVIKVK